MPKDMHEKAAEHHEHTAKAHRTAAQQHGSNDHVRAKQQSSGDRTVSNLAQLLTATDRKVTGVCAGRE